MIILHAIAGGDLPKPEYSLFLPHKQQQNLK